MLVVEGLYFLCSENKGADQLHGHRKADLRLCFRICKKPVFSHRGLYMTAGYNATWPDVIKHFSCLTQLSMKLFLHINV